MNPPNSPSLSFPVFDHSPSYVVNITNDNSATMLNPHNVQCDHDNECVTTPIQLPDPSLHPVEQPPIRKSIRPHKPLTYLNDYVCTKPQPTITTPIS